MFKNLKKINLQNKFRLFKFEKKVIFVIAVAAVFLANLALSTFAFRIDLSKGKSYTLSNSSKKTLAAITKPVILYFFVSSDIPTQLLPLKTDVTDLLNEYKKQNNRVQLQILDPKKNQEATKKATDLAIPDLQFQQLQNDKYAVSTSKFGIAIEYDKKTEVIPQATDLSSLEYSITAAIYKLTRKELPKIAIEGAESFAGQADRIGSLRTVLQQQFQVDSVSISTESATPLDSVKTLLVFDNNIRQYSNNEVAQIKEFLDKNGTAIFFTDGVWVPTDINAQVQPAKHNLFNLFKEYGLTLQKNLVLSASYELVNFGNGVVDLVLPYPYWIKAAISPEQAGSFSNNNHLTFPWTSSINFDNKPGYEIKKIVETGLQSWQQTKDFTLLPQAIKQPQQTELKQFTIAAQSQRKAGGEIVVIPSSRFANEDYIRRGNDNLEFILNLVNNLASNGALSGIRRREVTSYTLPTLTESQKDIFKYGVILVLPTLFALYGAVRMLRRK